jgi:hypothetical protein
MGLLDKKERILDITLTDFGRDLFSKNQLQIKYYAFSDEGIDYSGSLSASAVFVSSSYDDQIYNTLTFESDQRLGQQTLKTFLFNGPINKNVSPQFITSRDSNTEITLERRYQVRTIQEIPQIQNNNPIVVRINENRNFSSNDRNLTYLYNQRLFTLLSLLKNSNK